LFLPDTFQDGSSAQADLHRNRREKRKIGWKYAKVLLGGDAE